MTYIAHLDLAINHSLKGDHWQELARAAGAPLREYEGPTDVGQVARFIRDASGMVLPCENFLLTSELVSCITESVAAGRRLLVFLDSNALEWLNPFLLPYGIEGTRIAAYSTDSTTPHPRLIKLSRTSSPGSFRNHPLLNGVKSLVIQQPNAIQYRARATPILSLPTDSHLLVEQTSDFPADWTSPDISCVVLSQNARGGGVLALSCSFLHDQYHGPFGAAFPGITAADNSTFAANILMWLADGRPLSRDLAAEAFDFVDHIERSLVEYVHKRLVEAYQDWWTDGVPVRVRTKCAQRCEEEGNKIPKAAYLDLIDVKEIVEKNWALFERDFHRVGWQGGKATALAWCDGLNEVRRTVMHPARRHFVPHLMAESTVSWLMDLYGKVQLLAGGASQAH